MTTRKKWDRKRNLVMAMANVTGCSTRFLADVFDLPHSRVSVILCEMRDEFGGKLNMQWLAGEMAKLEEKGGGSVCGPPRPFLRAELDRMKGEMSESDLDKDLAKLKKRPDKSTETER